MTSRKLISTTLRKYLNEQINSKTDLLDMAKNTDYETFLEKVNRVSDEYNFGSNYNILYRGMVEGDVLTDDSFMAEFLAHARGYGEWVDGIVVEDKILYFNDGEFNKLRKKIIDNDDEYEEEEEEVKEFLKQIYNPYFNNYKLDDAMYQLEYTEDMVIDFVYNFLVNSSENYSKYSDKKINDFFIPLLMYYAKSKGFNIISFRGSDFYGADEFVVSDMSRYTKLSDIWKSVNEK
jgi:hypothetical protein